MPQSKKRKKHGGSGSGKRPGDTLVGGAKVHSIAQRAATQHLLVLIPDFRQWLFREEFMDETIPAESIERVLLPYIDSHAAHTKLGSATNFLPHEFVALVE